MTKFLFATAVAVVMAGSAFAGTTSNSHSSSDALSIAQSGDNINVFEGSKIPNDTPSMGAPSINSTGPCLVSAGGALAAPGFGVSFGGAREDQKCNIRNDSAMIYQIVGRKAAIEHLCSDADMRRTLAPMGLCHIYRDPAPAVTPASAVRPAAKPKAPFTTCEFDAKKNTITYSARSGVAKQEALAACRAYLRK